MQSRKNASRRQRPGGLRMRWRTAQRPEVSGGSRNWPGAVKERPGVVTVGVVVVVVLVWPLPWVCPVGLAGDGFVVPLPGALVAGGVPLPGVVLGRAVLGRLVGEVVLGAVAGGTLVADLFAGAPLLGSAAGRAGFRSAGVAGFGLRTVGSAGGADTGRKMCAKGMFASGPTPRPAKSSAASQRPKTAATLRPSRRMRRRLRPLGSSRVAKPPLAGAAPVRISETRVVPSAEFISEAARGSPEHSEGVSRAGATASLVRS